VLNQVCASRDGLRGQNQLMNASSLMPKKEPIGFAIFGPGHFSF
jgi:hypothetical protein